ncbi:SusC/RagA family TonB-linked outer membrane protein [Pedobacter cryophilus]|uniref:SusC/RagA family TonB-linked outer membrane protein n=1 Tax=Pedobacter cryophilus TaxID=2571271 RepID=UPI00145CD933|nr:TonB-dependent receptor [Pedobacter cryophilus]
MKVYLLNIIFLFFSVPLNIFANNNVEILKGVDIRISGVVKGDNGETLPGASVTIKGTSKGAITDVEGRFVINVPSEQSILVISFAGMELKEVVVGQNVNLEIQLKSSNKNLDEVIVVGYGTVKKGDLTGSVASIKGDKITQVSSGSFETLLQGRVSGLTVINNNNDNPQGGSTVRIRGVSSINGSNAPLVVLDGIPLGDAGNLNAINPNIISSIEVLKDASATAIYGSRGANGVIMITTKRGTEGTSNVWFNQKNSFGFFSNELDYWRNPLDMAILENESYENAGVEPRYIGKKDQLGTYYPSITELKNNDWPYQTNWSDYIFRKASVTQDYNLGVEGGSQKDHYYVSLGYYKGQGMQIDDDYNKLSLDLSYDHNVAKTLVIRSRTGFYRGKRNVNYGMDYTRNPLFPVLNGDGSYYKMFDTDYGNPLALTNERTNKGENLDGYAQLQADWDILPDLKFVLRGNARSGMGNTYYFNPVKYTVSGDRFNGDGGIGASNYLNVTSDAYLTYTKKLKGSHDFSVMLGSTIENSVSKGVSTVGQGFSNTVLREENLGGADKQIVGSYRTESVLMSGFARLNYTFKNKYLFTFTGRADGSSKFGTNNKWGFFPSGALSWKLIEEDFIKNLNVFDQLKIRTSYGISGNQGISPYQSISQYGQDFYYLNGEEYIIYGVGREIGREGEGNRYVQWGGMASKDLRWEKTAQLDLGLDMSFFKSRLNLVFDYYHKITTDLLRRQFLNPSTGFDRVWTNDGEILNKGIELSLDANVITKGDLKFNAGLVFNANRNKVVSIGSKSSSGYSEVNGLKYEAYGSGVLNDAFLNVLAIGYPVNSFYGYQVNGIIQDMPDNPTKTNRPGEFNYVGLKADGTLDPNARTIIGDPNPDFTAGLNLQFTYKKGLDLAIQFYTVYGNDIFSTRKLNGIAYTADRWTPENPNNLRPSLRADRQYYASSWFVEDGSFLRVQNVTLGYTFSPKQIRKLQGARLYFNINNPFTFSNVSEFDPETSEDGRGSAPYSRISTFTTGLEIKF